MSAKSTLHDTSAKHTPNPVQATPGPWRFEPIAPEAHTDPDLAIDEDEVFWILGGELGEVLALVEERPRNHAEAEANARLIATSPRLLAALKNFFHLHHGAGLLDISVEKLAKALDEADAAIKEAEGAIA